VFNFEICSFSTLQNYTKTRTEFTPKIQFEEHSNRYIKKRYDAVINMAANIARECVILELIDSSDEKNKVEIRVKVEILYFITCQNIS